MYLNDCNIDYDISTIMDYCISRKIKDDREEFRYKYLNDVTCQIARATNEGYRKLKSYTEIIDKLNNPNKHKEDTRSDKEIMDDVLNKFKQRYKEGRG